jgi:large subunit ribosomal protein L21
MRMNTLPRRPGPEARGRRLKKERSMKYAIVQSGGKQYRAVEGSILEVDRLTVEPEKSCQFEEVLLLADDDKIHVGSPTVSGAKVKAVVLEHIRGPKVRVFHYKNKMRYRKTQGHRQEYTRVRVEKIVIGK